METLVEIKSLLRLLKNLMKEKAVETLLRVLEDKLIARSSFVEINQWKNTRKYE